MINSNSEVMIKRILTTLTPQQKFGVCVGHAHTDRGGGRQLVCKGQRDIYAVSAPPGQVFKRRAHSTTKYALPTYGHILAHLFRG